MYYKPLVVSYLGPALETKENVFPTGRNVEKLARGFEPIHWPVRNCWDSSYTENN